MSGGGGLWKRGGGLWKREAEAWEVLTPRQMTILQGLADGLSNAEIATRLEITINTVKFHLKILTVKTGCSSRTEMAVSALRRGLVE